jgi:hypothetical protein
LTLTKHKFYCFKRIYCFCFSFLAEEEIPNVPKFSFPTSTHPSPASTCFDSIWRKKAHPFSILFHLVQIHLKTTADDKSSEVLRSLTPTPTVPVDFPFTSVAGGTSDLRPESSPAGKLGGSPSSPAHGTFGCSARGAVSGSTRR